MELKFRSDQHGKIWLDENILVSHCLLGFFFLLNILYLPDFF